MGLVEIGDGIAAAALIVSFAALLVNHLGARRRDVLGIRPLLVFEYRADGWRIRNVGSGPAMDVVFTRLIGTEVYEHVRLPALAKDADFLLHFAKQDNEHRFAVTYCDFEGRPYTSQSVKDVSVAARGFVVPRPSYGEFAAWWQLPERDS